MAENCSHDCASCGEDCPSREGASLKKQPHAMSDIKRVIAVVSGKGGVGKSMTCALLAAASQAKGNVTAVMDADITGPSIPKMFGVHDRARGDEFGIYPCVSQEGVQMMSMNLLLENEDDPVVWRGALISGTVLQFWTDVIWQGVDFMFVDMPPGTGDVPLTVFQSLPVDGIIIVTSPQELVSMIVTKAVNMAKLMNIPILGIVENMSYIECPDCGKKLNIFGESHIDDTAKSHGLKVLAKIPIIPGLAEAVDNGLIEDADTKFMDTVCDKIEEL